MNPGTEGMCDALRDPAGQSMLELIFQHKRNATPAYWMMSLHYGLDSSSFHYKRFARKKSLLVAWSLQVGSVDNGVPLGKSAMVEFDDYLKRNPQLVFKKLWDAERVYVRSPYAVRNHIAPAIHHHNPNFVEYDAKNPGTIVWPPAKQQTEELDDFGFIRTSVKGRSGRTALPALRCMSWR